MMKSFLEAPSPSPKRPLRTGARARPLSEGMGEAILESTSREARRWQGGRALSIGLWLCLLPVPGAFVWTMVTCGSWCGVPGEVMYIINLAVAGILSIGAALCLVAANLLWNGLLTVLHWRSR